MDRETMNRYDLRAKVFKAMGHPTRLFILDELGKNKRCVYELTQMVEADTSTVSKHLSVLKEAGLVETEKKGTQIFYRLSATCVLGFFDCLEKLIRDRVDQIGFVCQCSE